MECGGGGGLRALPKIVRKKFRPQIKDYFSYFKARRFLWSFGPGKGPPPSPRMRHSFFEINFSINRRTKSNVVKSESAKNLNNCKICSFSKSRSKRSSNGTKNGKRAVAGRPTTICSICPTSCCAPIGGRWSIAKSHRTSKILLFFRFLLNGHIWHRHNVQGDIK